MRRILISLALFTLCLSGLKAGSSSDPISSSGHSIKQLKINTKPKVPTAGSQLDLLTISFKLKSKTGIAKNRIRVLVNDKALSIDGSDLTLTKSEDNDNDNIDIYDAEINLLGITFNQAENEIKVQYLLSSISPESIKAQDSRTLSIQNSSSSGSGASGGNGSGNGTNSNNGSVHQAPKLISMTAEVVNGEGLVSIEPQSIRLTIDHEQKLLDIVTKENFNPKTNIALKNLKITRLDPNDKEDKTNVSDDFVFDLETESVKIDSAATTANGQMLRTLYISNGLILNEIEKLKFKIDLSNFYENSGVKLASDLITNTKDSLSIKGESATNLTEPSFDDSLVFNLTESKKNKVTYTSNTTNLRASFSYNNGGLASLRSVKFARTKNNGNKINSYIQVSNKNHKLKLSVNNGTPSVAKIDENSATVVIPVSFSISTTSKILKSGGFLDSDISKTITVPFLMVGKTTDNLDVLLENTLSKNSLILFNGSIE